MLNLAFVLVMSTFGFAQSNSASDPGNVLAQVDQYVGAQVFESVLACEKKSLFALPVIRLQLDCDDSGCWSSSESIETNEGFAQVSNCSADAVSIYYDTGKVWDIAKTDFISANGNLGRLYLTQIANFIGYDGTITVKSAALGKLTMDGGKVVEVMNIQADYNVTAYNHSWPVIVSVLKTDNGSAQVARLRFGSDTIFRLKGM